MSTKGKISPNWSTEFDLYNLSLFRVPQSFLFKFSSLTKFLRFFGWAKRSLRLLDLFSPALYLLLKKFTGLPNGLFIWWVSLETAKIFNSPHYFPCSRLEENNNINYNNHNNLFLIRRKLKSEYDQMRLTTITTCNNCNKVYLTISKIYNLKFSYNRHRPS